MCILYVGLSVDEFPPFYASSCVDPLTWYKAKLINDSMAKVERRIKHEALPHLQAERLFNHSSEYIHFVVQLQSERPAAFYKPDVACRVY
jgi:hypothetical protein